jgi:histone acetyltransferase 1
MKVKKREMDRRRLINLDAFAPVATYRKTLQEDDNLINFKPPGEKIKTYKTKSGEFEVWTGNLADPEIRLLLDRMQIFISFFIEGGTPIKLDDQKWTLERWSVYFLYVVPSLSHPTQSTKPLKLRNPP